MKVNMLAIVLRKPQFILWKEDPICGLSFLIYERRKTMFAIVSLILLVVGAVTGKDAVIITSGLFGIAGAIEIWSSRREKEGKTHE